MGEKTAIRKGRFSNTNYRGGGEREKPQRKNSVGGTKNAIRRGAESHWQI